MKKRMTTIARRNAENKMVRLGMTLMMVLLLPISVSAQKTTIPGKKIFIPNDLKNVNLEDTASEWCYKRMALTSDFAIFWQKGFGDDLKNPPMLDGNDMHVDLQNLERQLERFYTFYRDTLQFIRPGSIADKYRMMVMINYSLEGTAYGGNYDDFIGAFWVAPNRIHDTKLNCVAHELGHSFQSQNTIDKNAEDKRLGKKNRGGVNWGGFFEMTSQWMLWQVNPEWVKDENYHWQAFKKLTYKPFLDGENIYHSPYILEYWGEKHGLPFIGKMYREGGRDDVVTAYKRLNRMTQEQFNDEMYDASCRIVNMDYPRVFQETRPYACALSTPMDKQSDGNYRVADSNCPGDYGFNAIRLSAAPKSGQTVKASFRGLVEHGQESVAGWRYGLVAATADGRTLYGPMQKAVKGTAELKVPRDVTVSALYLVVMAAPQKHWTERKEGSDKWSYEVGLSEGFEPVVLADDGPVKYPARPHKRFARELKVTAPPADKGIDPFYKKYVNVDGLYVVASGAVDDSALLKTAQLIRFMLSKRPDVKEKMVKAGCYTMVLGRNEQVCDLPEYRHICCPDSIAYWNSRARGFGGAPQGKLTASFGEENVLALPGDRYEGESICVHEFAHIIHTIGLCGVDPTFNERLQRCMDHARQKGLWKDTYAMSDYFEYFAECTQSFLDCNRYSEQSNGVHNAMNRREKLKKYDPEMYALLKEIFPEAAAPVNNKIHA